MKSNEVLASKAPRAQSSHSYVTDDKIFRAYIVEDTPSPHLAAPTDPDATQRWAETLLGHATTIGMHAFTQRAERLLTAQAPR